MIHLLQKLSDGRSRGFPVPSVLNWVTASLVLLALPVLAGDSKPIVDIRFGTYSQISGSEGDEWAPTWADDGNLYTGNDDGSDFGGISGRSVAFGKLTGDDPFHLAGATLSDMAGYGENGLGPDRANWKTMNSYC